MKWQFLKRVIKVIGVGLLLSGLAAEALEVEVVIMQTSVGEQTSLSRLMTDAKGNVHLSWVRSKEDVSTLYYATLTNDQWGEAKLIAKGRDWFVNWADFPFLAVNDDVMAAHWLRKSSEGKYDYDVVASFYNQQAGRWGEEITIHKDGVSAEHGFVSMLTMSEGRTFISWLDGRNTKPKGAADDHAMVGGMTLRAGIFDRDGKTLQDWQLDELACDCCQTSAAMTASGPVVVYRDRSDDEIRDIYITRFIGNGWSVPKPVFSDHWRIVGCPVNGPAVAASGNLMAVTWFSAKNDQPKVSLAVSQNDGRSFSAPVTIAEESTNGRVGITILDSGDIAVSWLETNGSEAQLKLALYNPTGELLGSVKVADTKASRRSGFPVIASRGNEVYVTWTDLGGMGRVKVARVQWDFSG